MKLSHLSVLQCLWLIGNRTSCRPIRYQSYSWLTNQTPIFAVVRFCSSPGPYDYSSNGLHLVLSPLLIVFMTKYPLVIGSPRACLSTGGPSSQYEELYCVFFFHFYANVQRNVTWGIYYCLTIELDARNATLALKHMEVLCYNGWKVWIYKALYGNATVFAGYHHWKTHRTITRRNRVRSAWGAGKQQKYNTAIG